MRRSRMVIRSGLILTLLIAAAGCGEADGPGGPGPRDPDPRTGTDDPAGTSAEPGDVVLQIDEAGGFVMPGHDFSTVPHLTVYADGRAITHGPQIMIWPPPALPNLQVAQLSEADVEALVDAAVAAGLTGEIPEYGQPAIADVPTTTVTITVDGVQHVHAANALGYGDAGPMPDDGGLDAGLPDDGGGLDAGLSDDDGSPDTHGLTESEVQARAALSEFVTTARDIVDSAAAEQTSAYQITGFAIRAWTATEGVLEDDVEIDVLDWPLDLALDGLDDCVVVDGADAQGLVELLAETNTMAQFEQGGTRYEVFFRPLLPHESTCDDVA